MSCQDGKCRVNIKKDVNCLCHLGESFWFNEIKETFWTTNEDPLDEKKKEGGHVGLKNLGATCYVNTFIQLWFNNPAFRSAINSWKLPNTETCTQRTQPIDSDSSKYIALDFGDNPNTAICGHLQHIFALLQYSERKYVDPSSLIQSLGLQANEQQDAQEFSKLFISVLGDALSTQDDFIRNIIENQFGGRYKYQTKCMTCNSVSERQAKFYELDLNIKGHVRLTKCLQEYFKEELLDGDNMYHCGTCQIKQRAIRKIVLENLPPVLNLQLLRFVFDRKTGAKNKLNCVTQFPDVLDMNSFMNFANQQDGLYHLTAVLIHRGLSAHSGHYIAHILDKKNNVWCRYNDESVSEMKGTKLQLGKEDDLEAPSEKNAERVKKEDGHKSKNAYMLVYTRQGTDSFAVNTDVPDWLKEIVAYDNSLFNEWIQQKTFERKLEIEAGLSKKKHITDIYSILHKKDGMQYEYISTAWLRNWLSPDLKTTPPIDNTILMCKHSNLDPYKKMQYKVISASAADKLYKQYGGLPRFKSDSLCSLCKEIMDRKETFDAKLTRDLKIIGKAVKSNSVESGYWVGKKSLRSFKSLALKAFELKNGHLVNGNCNGDNDDENDRNNNQENNSLSNHDDSINKPAFKFNDDILCNEHGNLCISANTKKIIASETWLKCKEYFPDSPEWTSDVLGCKECQKEAINNQEEKETIKLLISEQRQSLHFLNSNPFTRWKQFDDEGWSLLHVLTMTFVKEWRRRIKSARKSALSMSVDNTELICEHDMLLYRGEELIDEATKPDSEIFFIKDPEYNTLKNYVQFPSDIHILKEMQENQYGKETFQSVENVIRPIPEKSNEEDAMKKPTNRPEEEEVIKVIYRVFPDYCKDCRYNRLLSEKLETEEFQDASIFVSKRNAKDLLTSVYEKEDEDKDLKEEKPVANMTFPAKRKSCDTGNPRKSSRNRIKRGEYELRVDSSETLKALKKRLLRIYSVLPIEQNISFENGGILDDDNKTLKDLGVVPGIHLVLTVDHIVEGEDYHDIINDKPRIKEEGFKGTNLMNSSFANK